VPGMNHFFTFVKLKSPKLQIANLGSYIVYMYIVKLCCFFNLHKNSAFHLGCLDHAMFIDGAGLIKIYHVVICFVCTICCLFHFSNFSVLFLDLLVPFCLCWLICYKSCCVTLVLFIFNLI
jgi:hypothetical protein